jgi:hypothetical protein
MRTSPPGHFLAVALAVAAVFTPAQARQGPAQEAGPGAPALSEPVKVEIGNSKDLLAYFEKIGYTPKAWQAGIREVPRVYVADIPSQWRQKGSKELPILDKKRIFFRVITPIILRVNELIQAERDRAVPIAARLAMASSDSPMTGSMRPGSKRPSVVSTSSRPRWPWLRRPARAAGARPVSPTRGTRCSDSGPGPKGSCPRDSVPNPTAITASRPSKARELRSWPMSATSTRTGPTRTSAASEKICGSATSPSGERTSSIC